MAKGEAFNHIGDVYDRLNVDARLQPIEDDLTDIKTEQGLAKARNLVNRAIDEGYVTAATLSRRTNIKPSAISAFRTDSWTGKQGTLLTTASMLTRAVNQLLRQRMADQRRIDGFVKTKVVRAIYDIAQYVTKRRMIGAFVIPAGSGKTVTLEQLNDEIPGSVLLTVTRTCSSVKAFLQSWARALGLDEIGNAARIQNTVTNNLIRSDRLIMIDEVHKLQVPCLDVIREIYDMAQVPILLAGTPSFYKTLTTRRVGAVSSELMDQLYSRVGIFRDLTESASSGKGKDAVLFTREDIRKVFARGNVRLSRDGEDFLFRLANHPGSGALRVCRDLVQMVIDLYPGEEVTAALLKSAFATRLGTREAGFRIDLVTAHTMHHEEAAVASG